MRLRPGPPPVLRARALPRVYGALALVASLLLAAWPAPALELFDFEPPYLVDDDKTLKDHSLVLADGQWHAFYIRGESDTGTSTEDELGHAVSPNLRNWTILSPAITAGPEPWDARNTWAPHVIANPIGSGYMMYYTGANSSVVQRMGLATTLNPYLVNWDKYLNNPIAEPDSVVYEWETGLSFSSFRDPFVFVHDNQLHVLNTAVVRDTTLAAGRRGAIHHLAGTAFNTLVDVGPLALHNGPDNAAWHEIESVQLREVGDYWHLFYTETNVQGVQHLRSSEMDSGWDFANPTLIDIGTAAEVTPIPDLPRRFHFTRHIATPHSGSSDLFWVIRADTLWFQGNDSPVILRTKPLKEDWPVKLGTAFLGAPTFGDNPAERSEAPVGVVGNGFLSSTEFYGGPLSGYGAPGAQLGGGATGLMQSRTWTLNGTVIRLRVGGGGDPNCKVSLVDALTFATLASSTGSGNHVMETVTWDVSAHVGKQVYLQIEDNGTGPDGYINVDHIEELAGLVDAPPAPSRGGNRLLPNRPNPFNPRTELRFTVDRTASAQLVLHDVRGRTVHTFPRRTVTAGSHGWMWDGRDDRGREVASGIYTVRLLLEGAPVDVRRISLVR